MCGSTLAFMLVPILKVFGDSLNEGIISDLQDKYGKLQVPEGSIFLHNRALKELTQIGTQAERINTEKFGSEEFKLYLTIKRNVKQKKPDYLQLNNSVELLRAAIVAQKSFLRLEQIEIRFRNNFKNNLGYCRTASW